MAENTPSLHIVGDVSHRVDELARLRNEIEQRNRQETAIAELGQAALTGVDPYILLGQACALVELTLQVDHCRALELANGHLALRAAIGSNESFVHCRHDGEEDESIGMYVLVANAPVLLGDLASETRFQSRHIRNYHGVRAGAGVAIPAQHGALGVLLVYSSTARTFAEYEIAFLKSAANLLGEAFARARTESRLKQLIASTLDAVITTDRRGHVIEWNPQAEVTFGIEARSVMGRPMPRLLPPFAGAARRSEIVARRANGEEFPAEVTIDPVGSGEEMTFTAFIRDISSRKRAERELADREQRFRALVEKSWSGVALLGDTLDFQYAGSSTPRLLGYSEAEIESHNFLELVHPRDRAETRRVFEELMSEPHRETQLELRFLHRDGVWVWLEGFAQNLLHDPSVAAIVVNYRDITQRKATEKQLEYQAYYDALTGLPNRVLFRDRVVNAIAHARRERRGLAVMYLDLDHFKLVNDGLGHSVGDTLLTEVATRLQRTIRASDTISRLGGDEFTILLNGIDSAEAVATIARKILSVIASPIRVARHELFVTASIGVSLFPGDGEDVETLLKSADSAMYRAKELGRNQSQLFTAAMNERYVRRLALEQSLHHAIERRELHLHYQPVYDRMLRRIVSTEALIRWRHPERGLMSPAEFIPFAEETGMIIPIGEWVLREACAQAARWRANGLDLSVAVNISALQLHQPEFIAMVDDAIATSDIPPSSLRLEITESVAIQNFDLTMPVMSTLRKKGVGIAIDDFGTGQSSLIYLTRFPIDTIKIDQAFVRDLASDDSAAAIVSYVINLAHTLKLSVVAEGVETDDQDRFLRDSSCDQMQGYLYGRPMAAELIVQ